MQLINIMFPGWNLPPSSGIFLDLTPLHSYLFQHSSLTQARINSENRACLKDSLRGTSKQISPNIWFTTFIKRHYKYIFSLDSCGARGGVVVKALRYKPTGRGFDSRCCHWNFWVTSFRSHYGRGVDSASNRNENQVYFLGAKGGRCVRLTTLPTSCAVVMKSGNFNFLEHSGPLQACNGTALPLCNQTVVSATLMCRPCWCQGLILLQKFVVLLMI
jgi:hypothetical protein